MVSLNLARHYKDSLERGQRADGRGPLPPLHEKSLDGTFGPRRGEFGYKTGWMAENWWLGEIGGSQFRARRIIKPNGAEGRNFQINNWLHRDQPVDLQSVRGAAADVIKDTIQQWLDMAIGTDTVGTPKRARTSAGPLTKFDTAMFV